MYIKKQDLINLADRLESIQNKLTDALAGDRSSAQDALDDAVYLESVVDLWVDGIYEEVEP